MTYTPKIKNTPDELAEAVAEANRNAAPVGHFWLPSQSGQYLADDSQEQHNRRRRRNPDSRKLAQGGMLTDMRRYGGAAVITEQLDHDSGELVAFREVRIYMCLWCGTAIQHPANGWHCEFDGWVMPWETRCRCNACVSNRYQARNGRPNTTHPGECRKRYKSWQKRQRRREERGLPPLPPVLG